MAAEQDGEQQVVSLRLVFPQRKKKVKPRARQFPISCVQKYKNVKLNLANYFISAFGYQRVLL